MAILACARLRGRRVEPGPLAWACENAAEWWEHDMPFAEAVEAACDLAFGIASEPHPRRGTRWQKVITRQRCGPLRYGKPDPGT